MPDADRRRPRPRLALRSRGTASYTPVAPRRPARRAARRAPRGRGDRGSRSAALTGADQEYDAWRTFYAEVGELAEVVAPTLLDPLPHRARDARPRRPRRSGTTSSSSRSARSSRTVRRRHRARRGRDRRADRHLRLDLNDPSLVQNRCFLYHLIGNGTGEWRVPVGGMGAVTDALAGAAREAGAEIVTGAGVSGIESDGDGAEVTWHDGDGTPHGRGAAGCSRTSRRGCCGCCWASEDAGERAGGLAAQDQLPARPAAPAAGPGVDPADRVRRAPCTSPRTTASSSRRTPRPRPGGCRPCMPGEVYCHSLTDPSILGALAAHGMHTLTYFGRAHARARSFDADLAGPRRDGASRGALAAINEHLEEPIESCWPPTPTAGPASRPRSRRTSRRPSRCPAGTSSTATWTGRGPRTGPGSTPRPSSGASQTDVASVLLCGSGARRGGAVSGLGGHNAAQAVLASRLVAAGPGGPDFSRRPCAGNVHVASPRAALAQLAEQLTLNQRVRGSSP